MPDQTSPSGVSSDVEPAQRDQPVEFPNAIPPEEWYKYPPIEAGAPKPFSETRLGSLPLEIREKILDEVKEGRSEWKLRLFSPLTDHRSLGVLRGSLGVCSQLRRETLSLLSTTTSFHVHPPNLIFDLPRQAGIIGLSRICVLKLHADSELQWCHETNFPYILQFISTQLPILTRLQLITEYDDDMIPISNSVDAYRPIITRRQKEVRALMRFGAFLVKRHANLDLLLWPSDSPVQTPYLGGWGMTSLYYIDVIANTLSVVRKPQVKRGTPLGVSSSQRKDEVLNATKIRRYTWAELAHVSVDELVIPTEDSEEIKSSEVLERHSHFSSVDEYGYLTNKEWDEKGLRRTSVDDLIEAGRERLLRKPEAVEEDEGQREGLDQAGRKLESDKE